MPAITEQMFRASYETGKKLYTRSILYTEGVRILEKQYGMNPNSAGDYLYAYKNMAEGKRLTRIISQSAFRYYLDRFFEDKGREGLQKALSAIQQTIDYREGTGNSTTGLKQICTDYLLLL